MDNLSQSINKEIQIPAKNPLLAEFLGALVGDGGITRYQVKVTGRESTDAQYKKYIQILGEGLFNINSSIFVRGDCDCWIVIFSSVKMVEWLAKEGLPPGNKLHRELTIPEWIFQDPNNLKAYIRGLFDTDGCVYLDKHLINGKMYFNLGVAITSYNPQLVKKTVEGLKKLQFSPTISIRRNILLRKAKDIEMFFCEIKPGNQKHWDRYKEFLQVRRGVRVV